MEKICRLILCAVLLSGCNPQEIVERCDEQSEAYLACGFELYEDYCDTWENKRVSASLEEEILCRMDCHIVASCEDLADYVCREPGTVSDCDQECRAISKDHFDMSRRTPCSNGKASPIKQ